MELRRSAKPLVLVGVFVAGMIVAGVLLWNPSGWLVADASAGKATCGEVLVAGGGWLGGTGVDVRSNGDRQTTGTGCANNDQQVYNLEANPPIFGYGWQCVELVNRLYATKGWFPKLWLGDDTNHGAKWLYTYAERGKYAGLSAHANGSGYKPVPGDMIVHSNGTFGHVSIVDRVAGETLYAVEQNNSLTGWATYAYDPKTGKVSRDGATVSGYIHAAKNGNGAELPKVEQPKVLSFKVTGTCTTVDGTLTAQSSGFTPGGMIDISAWYADGRAYTNLKRDAIVRPDGSIPWTWPCKGDSPGTYGTRIVDLSTGRHVEAQFTIGGAPKSPDPPIRTTLAPPPKPLPVPVTRTVTIFNKVTNGPAAMRDDDHPAYLSSATRNYCRTNGCMLAGTEVRTGAQITAVCQVQGDRTTNGQDNSSIDDSNPGLFTTTLWYGIRWSDGRFGYISSAWVQPGQRDGLGLPRC